MQPNAPGHNNCIFPLFSAINEDHVTTSKETRQVTQQWLKEALDTSINYFYLERLNCQPT